MSRRLLPLAVSAIVAIVAIGFAWTPHAQACGGFFCTDVPVDQNAERIIFSQNTDGTVSAYVQIEYTGSADFSWILPLPEAIDADGVEVPEDAMAAFQELEAITNPLFVRPPLPECARRIQSRALADSVTVASVEVVASGEVGPYGFDVVRSDDPDALVVWLRDNGYRVTEAMEPLIDVYVDEEFAFLAMKLRPDFGTQDIEPVKVTYRSAAPMIPLRLTAVAANPDMAVRVWIYADMQAKPTNYARMDIRFEDIVLSANTRGDNYRSLVSRAANEYGGRAFVTEYAGPTSSLIVAHPLLRELGDRFAYITRLNTVISPEEMTVDPVFGYDPDLDDVSNVHDLTGMRGLYDCERGMNVPITGARGTLYGSSARAVTDDARPIAPAVPDTGAGEGSKSGSGTRAGMGIIIAASVAFAVYMVLSRVRRRRA